MSDRSCGPARIRPGRTRSSARRPRTSARRSPPCRRSSAAPSELAYFEGYTYREVAEVTGVAAGTAAGRLRLGLAKLRESLAGSAGAPVVDRRGDPERGRRSMSRDQLRAGRRAGGCVRARSRRCGGGSLDERASRDLRPAARRGARPDRRRGRPRSGRRGRRPEPGPARSADGDGGGDAAGASARDDASGSAVGRRCRAAPAVVADAARGDGDRRRGPAARDRPRGLGPEPQRAARRARGRAPGRRERRRGLRGVGERWIRLGHRVGRRRPLRRGRPRRAAPRADLRALAARRRGKPDGGRHGR